MTETPKQQWLKVDGSLFLIENKSREKQSRLVREGWEFHQGSVYSCLNCSVFLGTWLLLQGPSWLLELHLSINMSKKMERRWARALFLKALPVSCTEPFCLCHVGSNLVTLSILVVRRLGNTDFVMCGCVPQVKSGALLLRKKERKYFGDNYQVLLVVNLDLRRWSYTHIKFQMAT